DLEGNIQLAPFVQAWQQLVQRHDAFRTAVVWEDLPEPVQAVQAETPFRPRHLDWRGMDPNEQQRQFETLLEEDRRQGFDLQRPPLMRVTVIQLEDARLRVLWSLHHILLDGWSSAIVLDELFALLEGRQVPAPSRRPFREYVEWLHRQDQAEATRYWSDLLADF